MRLRERYGSADNLFYYGFEGANELAKCTYPLYNEYLNSSKQLDDQFFTRLTDNFTKSITKDKTLLSTLDNWGKFVKKGTPEKSIISKIASLIDVRN